MAIATSNIAELNKDPKFAQDMQTQFFASNKSSKFYNTDFQSDLTNGSQVKLINEPIPYVTPITGHEPVPYGKSTGFQELFEVTEALAVAEEIFDTDNVQASFDVKKTYIKNGLRGIYREMDKKGFEKLKTNSFTQLPTTDLTGLSNDVDRGNAIYEKYLAGNAILDAQGYDTVEQEMGRRISCFHPEIYRYFKRSDNFVLATEEGDERFRTGKISTIDGVEVESSINLFADTTSFDVSAKGLIPVGAVRFTVDNGGAGTINPPKIGDTFVNNSQTFTILNVNEVTVNVEYDVQIDRPLGTQIADDATISISGRHTVYVPLSQGMAGASVVQAQPQFKEMDNPANFSTLIRSNPVMFDYFLPVEKSKRVVMLPFLYRTIV